MKKFPSGDEKSHAPVKTVQAVWRVRLPMCSTVMAVLVYGYLLLPSLTVIPLSFSASFSWSDISLSLYQRLFVSDAWMQAARNSGLLAVLASTLAVLAGLPAAYAFVRGRFRGKDLATLLVVSPLFVPVIVLALGLYFLGVWLGMLGAFPMLVLSHAMAAMPFVVVMVISGLKQVNPELEQAGYVMGASAAWVFLTIVLPQIRISLIAAWLFSFLVSFDEVIIAWFVSGPQTETLPVRMYSSIMWDNTPEIAAVSTLLTLVSFCICLLMIKIGGVQTVQPLRAVADTAPDAATRIRRSGA